MAATITGNGPNDVVAVAAEQIGKANQHLDMTSKTGSVTTIYGVPGTEAETFANESGFIFVPQ